MFDLMSDVRLAVRRIRRGPLLALTATLTLALGIGAASAIYAVLEPVFLSALPFPDAERIVMLSETEKNGSRSRLGYSTISDLRTSARSFSSIAAMSDWQPTYSADTDAERLQGQSVTHEFFTVLGVRPLLGRAFTPGEDRPESDPVAILGHGLWQRRFGGDSSVVGRLIELSERPYRVIGVLPAAFESVLEPGAELWRPLRYADTLGYACRTCRHLRAVGRLEPGTALPAANAELHALFTRFAERYPTEYGSIGLAAERLRDDLTRGVRAPLFALGGAVALLLLIALANVTNLFIARTMQRESELTVRTALGAGRWRLVRELTVEAVLIGAIGGLVGVAMAHAGIRALIALAPPTVPRLDQVGIDVSVFAVAFGLSFLLGLTSGVLPGWLARSRDGDRRLHLGTRTVARGARHSMRRGLVMAEFALALMLLAGAGLLVRSMQRLLSVDAGFTPTNRVTLSLSLSGARYEDSAATYQGWRSILEAAQAVPGVAHVALTSQLPLSGDFDSWGFHQEQAPKANPEDDPSAFRFGVDGDYFATMGLTLERGRFLATSDDASAPMVVVVNQRMVELDFAGRDPIGQRVKFGGDDGPWRTIVGVVNDVKHRGLDARDERQFYLPTRQNPYAESFFRLVVASKGDPDAVLPGVRAAIRGVDPTIPVTDVLSLDEIIARSSAQRRFAQRLFQLFSMVALLLAGIGIYGVLASLVGERTREMGIRSALGATQRNIVTLVVRQGLTMAAIGISIGLIGAFWLSGALRALLFGVAPRDPLTLSLVALALGVIALLAAVIPAWRASRVEAMVALRSE
jgi:putative ABC transport system permease protein